MTRKWTVLAATMVTTALALTGFSMADDEKSPLHQLMEKVNKANGVITKGVRTQVAYKKASKDVADKAAELVELGKKAREFKDAAEKQKKSYDTWTKLSDDFIKQAEAFSTAASKSSASQASLKAAYKNVSKTCTNCHNEFRVEEE